MKKLYIIVVFLLAFIGVKAQNTVTVPGGSQSGMAKFRTTGTLTDSLAKRYFIIFDGGAYNELYTATYIRKNFLSIAAFNDSLTAHTAGFDKNFKVIGDSVHFADSIHTQFSTFDHGVNVGSGANTNVYSYTVNREVSSNAIKGALAVTVFGAGAIQIQTNGLSRTTGILASLQYQYPHYILDSGVYYEIYTARRLNHLADTIFDICTGCTIDTAGGHRTLTVTGGPFLPLTLTGNTTVANGSNSLYFSTAGGIGTKMFNDGSVIIGSSPSQTALPYTLAITNAPSTDGFLLIGSFSIDNAGDPRTGTQSPGDNSTKLATTAYVDAAISGSGLTVSHFIIKETPSGTVNSSNTAFTIAFSPVTSDISITRNGQEQYVGVDYTRSGVNITYLYAPTTGDIIRATYIK